MIGGIFRRPISALDSFLLEVHSFATRWSIHLSLTNVHAICTIFCNLFLSPETLWEIITWIRGYWSVALWCSITACPFDWSFIFYWCFGVPNGQTASNNFSDIDDNTRLSDTLRTSTSSCMGVRPVDRIWLFEEVFFPASWLLPVRIVRKVKVVRLNAWFGYKMVEYWSKVVTCLRIFSKSHEFLFAE